MKLHLPGAAFTLQWKQGKYHHLVLTVRPQLNDPWGPACLGSNSDGNNTLTGSWDKEERTRHSMLHKLLFWLCHMLIQATPRSAPYHLLCHRHWSASSYIWAISIDISLMAAISEARISFLVNFRSQCNLANTQWKISTWMKERSLLKRFSSIQIIIFT